ncbi:DnaJ domain-containing protein [Rhodoblastus sp.]|uniref:DnaJ domain-containing protein n=1 Tax=Rhodoblastus sp. TaxID=1962975 RepID=UPI003F9B7FA6
MGGTGKRNKKDRGRLLRTNAKSAGARSRTEREREADERERQRRQEDDRKRDAASGNVSAAQALEILGLVEGANEEQIHAAYQRLIKRVHPDVGGSNYFARQLNTARDVLLKPRRG